jgi:large conductance mechanosensitive channel
MVKGFRDFISRGNVVDLAVGIIIGAAFGAIVKSFVDDVLMPPIGMLLGGVDFSNLFAVLKAGMPPGPYATVAEAKAAGAVTINYGLFFNTIVSFLIIALAVYLFVRVIERVKQQPAPGPATTKECGFCAMTIPVKAVRCPHCTAQLG